MTTYTLIAADGNKFYADKQKLIATCKYFARNDSFEQNKESIISTEFPFKQFGSFAIQLFIWCLTNNDKMTLIYAMDTDTIAEFNNFVEYIGCEQMQMRANIYKAIMKYKFLIRPVSATGTYITKIIDTYFDCKWITENDILTKFIEITTLPVKNIYDEYLSNYFSTQVWITNYINVNLLNDSCNKPKCIEFLVKLITIFNELKESKTFEIEYNDEIEEESVFHTEGTTFEEKQKQMLDKLDIQLKEHLIKIFGDISATTTTATTTYNMEFKYTYYDSDSDYDDYHDDRNYGYSDSD